jgi:hypothetical protein
MLTPPANGLTLPHISINEILLRVDCCFAASNVNKDPDEWKTADETIQARYADAEKLEP